MGGQRGAVGRGLASCNGRGPTRKRTREKLTTAASAYIFSDLRELLLGQNIDRVVLMRPLTAELWWELSDLASECLVAARGS